MEETKIVDKLRWIVNRVKDFPDFFKINVQDNIDVENYFKINFKCHHLPIEFLSFMKVFDGLQTDIFTIFSITGENKNGIVMKYEDYSKQKHVDSYFKEFKMKTESKLLFFACDNQGGRFAFKKDIKDNNVYYINNKEQGNILIYDSFLDLIMDKINEYISIKI